MKIKYPNNLKKDFAFKFKNYLKLSGQDPKKLLDPMKSYPRSMKLAPLLKATIFKMLTKYIKCLSTFFMKN